MRVLTEWGMAAVEALRERASVLVIVDVLSFSTAVDVAAGRGAAVIPFADRDRDAARAAAERLGAILAQPRGLTEGFSLSPMSLMAIPAGTRLLLPSPNGSRLSAACGGRPVLAGCLRNAAAVARTAHRMAMGGTIGVIPAGERWPDGSLRPAIEDLLGAGAIIHHLDLPLSPEAQVARDAFRAAGDDAARLIRTSVSGRELTESGYGHDVDVAVAAGASSCVPLLSAGVYRAAEMPIASVAPRGSVA